MKTHHCLWWSALALDLWMPQQTIRSWRLWHEMAEKHNWQRTKAAWLVTWLRDPGIPWAFLTYMLHLGKKKKYNETTPFFQCSTSSDLSINHAKQKSNFGKMRHTHAHTHTHTLKQPHKQVSLIGPRTLINKPIKELLVIRTVVQCYKISVLKKNKTKTPNWASISFKYYSKCLCETGQYVQYSRFPPKPTLDTFFHLIS